MFSFFFMLHRLHLLFSFPSLPSRSSSPFVLVVFLIFPNFQFLIFNFNSTWNRTEIKSIGRMNSHGLSYLFVLVVINWKIKSELVSLFLFFAFVAHFSVWKRTIKVNEWRWFDLIDLFVPSPASLSCVCLFSSSGVTVRLTLECCPSTFCHSTFQKAPVDDKCRLPMLYYFLYCQKKKKKKKHSISV